MKRIVLLVCIVTAMALCASGQMLITFSDMPSVNRPLAMPDDYPTDTYLYWDNFYYVSPNLWSGAGPGFFTGPDLRVIFIGGPMCTLQPNVCHGSIKVAVTPNATASFQPVSISMAAGWVPNSVVVTAYNHSKLVGSRVWRLTTLAQRFDFPAEWTNITQLTFYPSPARGQMGSMVAYAFLLNLNK